LHAQDGWASDTELRKRPHVGKCRFDFEADAYAGARSLNWPNIASLLVWPLSVGTLLVRA
jgi:hypothetical protein